MKEEIRNYATTQLRNTMYEKDNDTCLYGVCHYCSSSDPVCGTGDILEGALIFWLPRHLRLITQRHPWQRTYKKNKLAAWEIDDGYCDKVLLCYILTELSMEISWDWNMLRLKFKQFILRHYPVQVKNSKIYSPLSSNRLLDLIDTAIFDFLMDNGDRHHYEFIQSDFRDSLVLLMDNGKSLGNPNIDHLDILAPLYQCCM